MAAIVAREMGRRTGGEGWVGAEAGRGSSVGGYTFTFRAYAYFELSSQDLQESHKISPVGGSAPCQCVPLALPCLALCPRAQRKQIIW